MFVCQGRARKKTELQFVEKMFHVSCLHENLIRWLTGSWTKWWFEAICVSEIVRFMNKRKKKRSKVKQKWVLWHFYLSFCTRTLIIMKVSLFARHRFAPWCLWKNVLQILCHPQMFDCCFAVYACLGVVTLRVPSSIGISSVTKNAGHMIESQSQRTWIVKRGGPT